MDETNTNALDKSVIITGGGTGIGRETARRFADAGARVLVVGRTETRLKETAEGRPNIRPFAADIADPQAPARIVDAAVAEFGRIDVLVNNAAIVRPAALEAIDRDVAGAEVATNLTAPIFLTQRALPHLEAAGGAVVNVTSNHPFRGWPNNSVYGSTKVALDFLTRTWAVELAPRGIRVVSVAPGVTETPVLIHSGFTPEQLAESRSTFLRRIPLGRTAEPKEIAWWIVNVVRPEAAYLTGSVIRVDGGLGVA